MLVLSRKIGKGIVLPDTGIRIVVLAIHGKQVRIGIDGPRGALVYREEIWKRVSMSETAPHGTLVAETVVERAAV